MNGCLQCVEARANLARAKEDIVLLRERVHTLTNEVHFAQAEAARLRLELEARPGGVLGRLRRAGGSE